MGCTDSVEMALVSAAAKRAAESIDNSLHSSYDQKISPDKRLAARILMRYSKIILNKAVYCSFRFWKYSNLARLNISGISWRTVSFTEDTFNIFSSFKRTPWSLLTNNEEIIEIRVMDLFLKPSIEVITKEIESLEDFKAVDMRFRPFIEIVTKEIESIEEFIIESLPLNPLIETVFNIIEKVEEYKIRDNYPRPAIKTVAKEIEKTEDFSIDTLPLNPPIDMITKQIEKIEDFNINTLPPNPPIQIITKEIEKIEDFSINTFPLNPPIQIITKEIKTFKLIINLPSKPSVDALLIQEKITHIISYTFLTIKKKINIAVEHLNQNDYMSALHKDTLSPYSIPSSYPITSKNIGQNFSQNNQVFSFQISVKIETLPLLISAPEAPHPIERLSLNLEDCFHSTQNPFKLENSQSLKFKPAPILTSPRSFLSSFSNETSEKLFKSYQNTEQLSKSFLSSLSTDRCLDSNFTLPQIVKIFEDLMDQKHSLDLKELKDQIKPRELYEFFPDYLNRNFGIQKVGQKMLSKVLKSLQDYSAHPYVKLFCRCLKTECADPLPLSFLVFLCKSRADFNKIIEKNPFKKGSVEEKQWREYGGLVPLVSVFPYIQKEFASQEVYADLILKLCPKQLLFEEYIIFYALYKINKTQVFPKNHSDVLAIVANLVPFSLTPSQYSSLSTYIKENEIKSISLSAFRVNSMNLKYYLSKCEFLTALASSYEIFKAKTILSISDILNKFQTLNHQNFISAALELDPKFSEEFLSNLFKFSEEFTEDSFVQAMIHNGAGLLTYFHHPLFSSANKPRRVDYADLCIKPNDAFDLRSSLSRSNTLKK